MKISAVKLYENGFMTQSLAFGGEGMEGVDPSVKYRSSLQNYVIDTGSEVMLPSVAVRYALQIYTPVCKSPKLSPSSAV